MRVEGELAKSPSFWTRRIEVVKQYARVAGLRVPVRVDYSDYRTVSGVKVPFKRVATWTDGRTVFQLDSVQVNTAVDAARFAKPKPPAPPKK